MPDVRARRRRQRQRDQQKTKRRRSITIAWRYLAVGSLLGGLVVAVVAVIRTIGVDEISNTWKMVSLASGLTAGGIVGGYLGLSLFSRTNLTS